MSRGICIVKFLVEISSPYCDAGSSMVKLRCFLHYTRSYLLLLQIIWKLVIWNFKLIWNSYMLFTNLVYKRIVANSNFKIVDTFHYIQSRSSRVIIGCCRTEAIIYSLLIVLSCLEWVLQWTSTTYVISLYVIVSCTTHVSGVLYIGSLFVSVKKLIDFLWLHNSSKTFKSVDNFNLL